MKPDWLKIERHSSAEYSRVKRMIEQHALNTICTSGKCPNQFECWNRGTATFMILGDRCTRNCRFCATPTGKGFAPDPHEPEMLADAIERLKVKYAVITSVTRDDLPDQGAGHWSECIAAVRNRCHDTKIEILLPDFNGNENLLDTVIASRPDVISHNLETVERLTPLVRSRATYRQSLRVLRHMAQSGLLTKTGIMVGLGETEPEVAQTLQDAYQAGCRSITIGQYLQPSKNNLPVAEYVHPGVFAKYRKMACDTGFSHAVCGPLVRSSYHAEEFLIKPVNN